MQNRPLASSAHILIVDDCSDACGQLSEMLQQLGYKNISSATDGTPLLDGNRADDYKLILLDMHMPVVVVWTSCVNCAAGRSEISFRLLPSRGISGIRQSPLPLAPMPSSSSLFIREIWTPPFTTRFSASTANPTDHGRQHRWRCDTHCIHALQGTRPAANPAPSRTAAA